MAEWLALLTPDHEVPGLNPAGRKSSAHVVCRKPCFITLSLSQDDLDNVERDVKHQIVIIINFN